MTKAIVDLVASLNGMIARENGDEDWLPESGWDEFLKQIEKYGNVIIGRETYELVKQKYDHDNFDAITGYVKIIVTRDINYPAPSSDYIIAHSPGEALDIVGRHGLRYGYVGGGGKLIGAFLGAKLVEGVHLTILPILIAQGRPLTGNVDYEDTRLSLIAERKTDDGKIVLDYEVSYGD